MGGAGGGAVVAGMVTVRTGLRFPDVSSVKTVSVYGSQVGKPVTTVEVRRPS